MRVAFVPVVPSSGRNPDSVAYFVRPGEVPDELADMLERYVVLAKPLVGNATLRYSHIRDEYERRVGLHLGNNAHAAAARALRARVPRGKADRTIDPRLAEFNTAFNQYVYTPAWVDLLVTRMSTVEEFRADHWSRSATGHRERTIGKPGCPARLLDNRRSPRCHLSPAQGAQISSGPTLDGLDHAYRTAVLLGCQIRTPRVLEQSLAASG